MRFRASFVIKLSFLLVLLCAVLQAQNKPPRYVVKDLGALPAPVRPAVPRRQAAGLGPDGLPVPISVPQLGRPDAERGDLVGKAEFRDLSHGVRKQVDPHTETVDDS